MLSITLQTREEVPEISQLAEGYINANWWPELRLDLSLEGIAADFYLFYAMKDATPYLSEKFEEYSQVVAKQVAIYLDAAVGGEFRHAGRYGMKGSDSRSIARRQWRTKRQATGHKLLMEARDAFYNRSWKSGFGGPRWGNIADLLIKHLNAETDPHLFVDHALALQHNTGTVFNKINNYWKQTKLQTVLNANLREEWETLVKHGSPWARQLFLTWLGEEDELQVTHLEVSRPREVQPMNGEIKEGSRVRVSPLAKAKSVRGKEGFVVKLYPNEGNGKGVRIKLLDGSGTKLLSIENLEAIDLDQIALEYIEEA